MIVDHSTKTIRPKNLEEFQYVLQFFEDNSEVTVTVEPYVRLRSMSQNGLFYKYIQIIAEETGNSKDDIKTHIKNEHGPRNDDGSLKSTSNYTTVEMNFMIDRLYQFGTENRINLPRPEDLKNNNIKIDGK